MTSDHKQRQLLLKTIFKRRKVSGESSHFKRSREEKTRSSDEFQMQTEMKVKTGCKCIKASA
jgi:hypothetical protein